MYHDKTTICFTDKKGVSYRVEYHYKHTANLEVFFEKKGNSSVPFDTSILSLQADIFENDKLIKTFDPIPYTSSASNPTKTQAKELIKMALDKIKKANKI